MTTTTPPDRRTTRGQAKALERRRDEAAKEKRKADAERHRIANQDLADQAKDARLRRREDRADQRRLRKTNARADRTRRRRNTRARIAATIKTKIRADGAASWIPILGAMSTAWVGQIGFANNVMHWPVVCAVLFAAGMEGSILVIDGLYRRIRAAQPTIYRGGLFHASKWALAAVTAGMNYWHQLPQIPPGKGAGYDWTPTPLAVTYALMSLLGPALLELREMHDRYQIKIKYGLLPHPMPRLGWRRWTSYPGITRRARRLAIKHPDLRTGDLAWQRAVLEVEDEKALKAAMKTAKETRTNNATHPSWITRVERTDDGVVLVPTPLEDGSEPRPVSVLTWDAPRPHRPVLPPPVPAPVLPAGWSQDGNEGTRRQGGNATQDGTGRDEDTPSRGRNQRPKPRTNQLPSSAPSVDEADLDPALVQSARDANAKWLATHGRRIGRDGLKIELGIGTAQATALNRLLIAEQANLHAVS